MSVNIEAIGPKYHLGHVVLDSMKKNLQYVCQIDAATGEEETYASVLSRSIKLARALKAFGFKPGDVLAVGGRNHLDIHIPFYAAIFNGFPIVGVDPFFKYDEIKTLFNLAKPKIAFCQSDSYDNFTKVAEELGLKTKIITFDDGECNLHNFIQENDTNAPEEDYKPEAIDIDKIYAFLISTSGTTGKVKLAAFRHKPFLTKILALYNGNLDHKAKIHKIALNLSPVQWISSYFLCLYVPLMGDTMVQTSKPEDVDHIIDIINKYRPNTALISPTFMFTLISRKDDVDLKCFTDIGFAGSKIYPEILRQFKELLSEDVTAIETYGMTEMIGVVLGPNVTGPIGSCGRPIPLCNVKLIDPDSGAEINEPNVIGELWAKGLSFTEYYNDPEETRQTHSEDGYFKTGDLMYRDENDNYYFVDRIKTLIKYRNFHVLPSELEGVIRTHPHVKDVCVIGINDLEDGQIPVACVVKEDNCDVTAQEIKDLVSSKLSKNKELRGGVIFLDSFPYTSSGKLARAKLQQIASNYQRE